MYNSTDPPTTTAAAAPLAGTSIELIAGAGATVAVALFACLRVICSRVRRVRLPCGCRVLCSAASREATPLRQARPGDAVNGATPESEAD